MHYSLASTVGNGPNFRLRIKLKAVQRVMSIFRRLFSLYKSLKAIRTFKALPERSRDIVFYSEGRNYGVYFADVIKALREDYGQEICFITSDTEDPFLTSDDTGIHAFYIPFGSALIYWFETLSARVLIMTMPDLHTFHIKRSQFPVHYIYLHHSIVSSHMCYRKAAFDHFDSILCAGPHHKNEIRQQEELYKLPKKTLYEHGYGPLDHIMREAEKLPSWTPDVKALNILIAPSWGALGLIETGIDGVVSVLLEVGHKVVVRPHPRTKSIAPQALDLLDTNFGYHPNFAWD